MKRLRTCVNDHSYYKSSDCPVCPICEKERSKKDFLLELSAPARRALENKGIKTLKQLSQFTESELLSLHGIGPSSLPKIKTVLFQKGLQLKA